MRYNVTVVDEHRNQVVVESSVMLLTGVIGLVEHMGGLNRQRTEPYYRKLRREGYVQIIGRNTTKKYYRFDIWKLEEVQAKLGQPNPELGTERLEQTF